MNDHARELRRYASVLGRPTIMLDAADEIERLAAKIEAAEKSDAESIAMYRKARDERDALRARIEEMERQESFDADSDVFRSAFEAALKAGNWPATRQGDGYRSPSTQIAWRVAFSTVNRLKLYLAPGAQPAPSVPTALLVAVADLVAQMEIVARVGFVDVPDDKDSCAAFCVAEGTWLELMRCVESLAASLAAAPEAKP